MSDSTKLRWLTKAKEICSKERFELYEKCSNDGYRPYLPTLYDRQEDPEGVKNIEACNEACNRAANPIVFTDRDYGSKVFGIVMLIIVCSIIVGVSFVPLAHFAK